MKGSRGPCRVGMVGMEWRGGGLLGFEWFLFQVFDGS